jgi:hypothetical protein
MYIELLKEQVMDGFPIETFFNAHRAIQPKLDQDVSLAKRVSALVPLKEKDFCKILSCNCGGHFHIAGRVDTKSAPIFARVCDSCGGYFAGR